MANKKANAEALKKQTIGVEIEMSKIAKEMAAKVVSCHYLTKYGTEVNYYYDGRHHHNWVAIDHKGRKWQFMDDGSADGDWGRITCEMVTPILTYDDIPDLQEIVRALRQAGAKSGAHYNAGVHIHVGANFDEDGGLNTRSTINLVNLIAAHERLLCAAVSVTPERQRQWAHFVDPDFLRAINGRNRPANKNDLGVAWYGSQSHLDYIVNHRGEFNAHYDGTRYHLLNLHAIWDKGTVEFRCFEFHNNLHAGELKAWIQLCLAMVSYAKLANRCTPRQLSYNDNPKYALNSWLKNLGMIGDEFKTARKMLTKHLTGDTAYRSGRPVADSLDDLGLRDE